MYVSLSICSNTKMKHSRSISSIACIADLPFKITVPLHYRRDSRAVSSTKGDGDWCYWGVMMRSEGGIERYGVMVRGEVGWDVKRRLTGYSDGKCQQSKCLVLHHLPTQYALVDLLATLRLRTYTHTHTHTHTHISKHSSHNHNCTCPPSSWGRPLCEMCEHAGVNNGTHKRIYSAWTPHAVYTYMTAWLSFIHWRNSLTHSTTKAT